MIKSRFGQRLRNKTLSAQVNKALCKVLCHNLCVVHELGVDPAIGVDTDVSITNVKLASILLRNVQHRRARLFDDGPYLGTL
jgi:hypothetical protein